MNTDLEEPSTERAEKKSRTPDAVRNLPAIYADSFYFNYWDNHIRMTFGESLAGEDYWRGAILLELRSAKSIVRRLQRIIAKLEQEQENPDITE